MKADGTDQRQVTSDEETTTGSPTPRRTASGSCSSPTTKDVKGHPPNKDVDAAAHALDGGKLDVLAKLFGGQGTINVPSWSPDSRRIAFVSYQLIQP